MFLAAEQIRRFCTNLNLSEAETCQLNTTVIVLLISANENVSTKYWKPDMIANSDATADLIISEMVMFPMCK